MSTHATARLLVLGHEPSKNRCRDFLAAHPQLKRVVAEGPLPGGSCQMWFEVELRDAAQLPAFIADAVKMPNFWRVFTRLAPFQHDDASLDACLSDARLTAPGTTVRISVFPTSFRDEFGDALWERGVALSPTNATHTLSMVRVSATRYAWDLISNATGSLQLTEPGLVSTVICRAYHKLEELFETHLASAGIDFSAMNAFDVGAAPGGWTDYLRHRCASVVAIDPGELHHSLHGARNVTHMQMTVERAVPTLREAGASVDMLLCDMNLSEDEALPLLAPLIELMPRGALFVFTLKYCGRGCRPESIDAAVQRLVAALAGPFDEFRTYWLWVNSLRERTIVARRTALPGTFAERKVTAATPKALAAVAAAAAARAAAPAIAPRSVSTWAAAAASTSDGDSAAAISLSDAPIHEADEASAAAAETASTAPAAVGDSHIQP